MTITINFSEEDTQETLETYLNAPKFHQAMLDLDRRFKAFDKTGKDIEPHYLREVFYSILEENDLRLWK